MAEKIEKTRRGLILYDDALVSQARHSLFSAGYWRRQDAVTGSAPGRTTAWMIQSGAGEWVLRHYRRGGMVGRLIRDHYVWLGLERARPWREWRLLAELHRRGLPVPRPVAARINRRGLAYTGDIITQRIANAESLARRIHERGLDAVGWRDVGHCVARFHAAGVCHADLNAHNILLCQDGGIYLLDFDRGSLRSPGRRCQRTNLERLYRSLRKLAGRDNVDRIAWPGLLAGYTEMQTNPDQARS